MHSCVIVRFRLACVPNRSFNRSDDPERFSRQKIPYGNFLTGNPCGLNVEASSERLTSYSEHKQGEAEHNLIAVKRYSSFSFIEDYNLINKPY